MAEFSAGLQTLQEERYVISLFLLLLGGKIYEFFMTVALAIPPLTMKNRPVRLFGHVRLIGRIRFIALSPSGLPLPHLHYRNLENNFLVNFLSAKRGKIVSSQLKMVEKIPSEKNRLTPSHRQLSHMS